MDLVNSVVETDWIHVISETSREKPYYCRRTTSDISWNSPVDFEVLRTMVMNQEAAVWEGKLIFGIRFHAQ